jgi:hypothetical protein
MKPHKHAELIKAWADGAEIEERYIDKENQHLYDWVDFDGNWGYADTYEYRIKPEPKPDVDVKEHIQLHHFQNSPYPTVVGDRKKIPNILFRFDGETGELKSAEVLK